MTDISLSTLYGQSAMTALGFFWKSGWAFVLGYAVSAMIQAFVPKARLSRQMGAVGLKSLSLSTMFGAVSSSCSFAALATARSLVLKGAHFVTAVAFMFASTNLVIELGILILIFLGWQFLLAEIVGGLLLIALSSALIKLTYPRRWMKAARAKVEQDAPEEEQDFDWRERIRSRAGWQQVGHQFVMEWKMVWKEILIGFTVAGFVAVLVPAETWAALFLVNADNSLPLWLIKLENAALAPFVAAATFIGSMGNIPLATVLSGNDVLFAGIIGFIYSDLMVPPLVAVNAKYYGWRVALYIAGIMYVSIVATALLLDAVFGLLGIVPHGGRQISEIVTFQLDYTFWLNAAFTCVVVGLAYLARQHARQHDAMQHRMEGDGPIKTAAAYVALAMLSTGAVVGIAGGI